MTPTVNPELCVKLVRPLIPAKSNLNPEALICIPRRASACDSVPNGPFPGRVFARPFTSPAIAELLVDAKDPCQAICHHIVLRKQFSRRRENRDTEIPKSIEAAVASKFLANKN